MEAKNLVILDLPAVVNYDHLPLRKALVAAFQSSMQCTPVVTDIDWSQNAAGVINQVSRKSCGRLPSAEETGKIKAVFHDYLKQYFLLNEDSFEVWSGIQNIFESLDKRPDWDYIIVSDYWHDSTAFMLNSCGIFSRKMKLLTADDGVSPQEIVRDITQNGTIGPDDVVYLMAREIQQLDKNASKARLHRINPPHKPKADLLEYPRFSKLFTSA